MAPSHAPTTATWRALGAGAVLLVLVVVFAVGLPRWSPDPEASSLPALPATLSGGWTRLVDASAPDAAGTAAYDDQQRQALAYVDGVLDRVYDEPTAFQAYVDAAGTSLVAATVFDAPGGAFAPANGVADPSLYGLERAPVELTRRGDAVCIANYQTPTVTGSGQDQQGADPTPLSVSCQAPHDGLTVQLGSSDMSVADTVALLDDLTDRLG